RLRRVGPRRLPLGRVEERRRRRPEAGTSSARRRVEAAAPPVPLRARARICVRPHRPDPEGDTPLAGPLLAVLGPEPLGRGLRDARGVPLGRRGDPAGGGRRAGPSRRGLPPARRAALPAAPRRTLARLLRAARI